MEFIKDIFRGVAIGIANIIPGVSGGTMMVSMGIYQDVIGAVTGVFVHMKKSIKILLPYVLGMFAGIVGLSFLIGFLFENYPFQTAMLFIGLIFGGIPLILPKVRGKRPSVTEVLVFLAFFALIIWMQFWDTGTAKVLEPGVTTGMSLVLIGTIAAATMVIPGVSGSMILMSLGYYTPIINQINAFIVAVMTLDLQKMLFGMGILVPFGIGVAAGIFLIAKLVEFLLKQHERMTYFAIFGLVLSSPVAVLSGIHLESISIGAVFCGLLFLGCGAFAAWLLGK